MKGPACGPFLFVLFFLWRFRILFDRSRSYRDAQRAPQRGELAEQASQSPRPNPTFRNTHIVGPFYLFCSSCGGFESCSTGRGVIGDIPDKLAR